VKRRTDVFGIVPTDGAVVRLVETTIFEQHAP
jgi:hypothetical protein